jgi:hypothetical protein
MGWAKKNEVGRIYRDKDRKTFFIVFVDQVTPRYGWDAIANVLTGSEPSLGTCGISPTYVSTHWLKRMAWSELPREWKEAFRPWLVGAPETIRGFWSIGKQPRVSDQQTRRIADRVL